MPISTHLNPTLTKKNNMKYLLKLFLLITLISCGGTPKKNIPVEFDYGKIERNTYLNSFFSLEIPFDSAWYIQSQEEMNKMVKQIGRAHV